MTTPMNLTVEQQLLVSAAADEIAETTSIHQLAIVRMLAIANEHNLNAANLLQDFGVELKSAEARKIPFVVEDLENGLSTVEALTRTPDFIPESSVMALAVAQSRGLQQPLNHALLNTTRKREVEDDVTEDFEAIDRVSKLIQKFVFTASILSFVMLFIIPQFKQMFEEFGMELPASMSLLISCSNFVVRYWFLFALAFLVIGGLLIYKSPRFITNYFSRWIPNRWQQPMLTKRRQKDSSVAWLVQASDNLPDTAIQFVSDKGIDTDILHRLAADKAEPNAGFLKALEKKQVISKRVSSITSTASSRESAAWILRKMSKENHSSRRRRGLASLRTLVWLGNFFVMFVSGWTAFAIFQSLLSIIQGLA